jgi:hypothetical protein
MLFHRTEVYFDRSNLRMLFYMFNYDKRNAKKLQHYLFLMPVEKAAFI